MVCQRCRGLLVCESLYGVRIEANTRNTAIRCINCGCVEDAVVRANRVRSSASTGATRCGMAGKGHLVFSKSDS
jgi:RNase P subunit RPR2